MKPRFLNRFLIAQLFTTSCIIASAQAAIATKSGTAGSTDLTGATAGVWTGGDGTNGSPDNDDVATWTSTSLGPGLTIGASNVDWGSINVTGATASISIAGTGTINTGNITLAGNRTLTIVPKIGLTADSIYSIADVTASTANDVLLSGEISGAFGITKSGAGTLTLSGTNIQTGATTISAGTLSVGASGNLGDASSNLVFDGGTLMITGTALSNVSTIGHAVSFTAAKAVGLDINNAAHTFTVDQVLDQTTGGFAKLGAGTVTLNQANTYTGTTTVGGGILALSGGNDRLATTGTVNFSAAGTLNVGTTEQSLANLTTLNNVTGTVTGTTGGKLTLTGSLFSLGGTSTSTTQTLNLSGLPTFFYNNSGGIFRVSGAINTTVNGAAGVLTLASGTNTITASAFGLGTFNSSVNTSVNSGTANLGTSNTINANTITIGGNRGAGTLQYPPGTTNPSLTLRGTDGTSRVTSMILSDHGGPTTNGGPQGTVNLTSNVTGTNTFDAMITTLVIGKNNRAAAAGGNALIHTGTFTMGTGTLDATTLIIAQNSSGFTLGGTTSKTTGNLTVTGGTIKVGSFYFADQNTSGSTGSALEANFNLNGAANLYATTIAKGLGTGTHTATRTFNWNDGTVTTYDAATDLNFGSGITVNLASTGTHTFDIGTSRTANVASVLAGADGTLVKAGAGTLTLSAANTYTGDTTVNGGTLTLADNAQLAFTIGANGVNNKITGTGTALLQGDFNLNLAGANTTSTNEWLLVDVGPLVGTATEIFDSTFSLVGFTEASNVHTKVVPGSPTVTWTFTEADGKLTVATSGTDYDTWLAGFTFGPGADTTPTGDPDGDGLINRQEHAFGLNPTSGSSVSPITVMLNKTTGKFTYIRRKPSLTGMTYKIETSATLTGWAVDTTATQLVTGTTGDNETVEVTLTGTLPLASSKLFVRVSATEP